MVHPSHNRQDNQQAVSPRDEPFAGKDNEFLIAAFTHEIGNALHVLSALAECIDKELSTTDDRNKAALVPLSYLKVRKNGMDTALSCTVFGLETSCMDTEPSHAVIFGQHVSPQIAEKLLRQPVELAGELRNVCVMFLDIRNFSGYAAAARPEAVMAYLNKLFGFMIDVVNAHHGIVNKFLGDGFMAVFGAPVDDAESCKHAAGASLEILGRLDRLNAAGAIHPTRVGIGLHVGEAVTGNVGSAERKEYAIIGDVVNLASRLEQATKELHARLLISEAVRRNLDATIAAEDLGLVELKGQPAPAQVYKIA